MSDGYQVYRKYPNRLRCWVHLLRNARGLEESLTQETQRFGKQTLDLMAVLMKAIREAREHPSNTPLTETYQTQLTAYRERCEQLKAASKLDDMDIFVRVVKNGGLAVAGREVGLSPASMGTRINILEQGFIDLLVGDFQLLSQVKSQTMS